MVKKGKLSPLHKGTYTSASLSLSGAKSVKWDGKKVSVSTYTKKMESTMKSSKAKKLPAWRNKWQIMNYCILKRYQ